MKQRPGWSEGWPPPCCRRATLPCGLETVAEAQAPSRMTLRCGAEGAFEWVWVYEIWVWIKIDCNIAKTLKYLDDSGFWICEKDAHPFADYFGVNRRAPGFLFMTHTNMMKWWQFAVVSFRMLCELNVPCFSSTGLLLHMASQPAVVCGRCVVAAVCCCSLGFLQMGAVLLNGCRTKTLEINGSNMIDLAIHTSNFDTVADSGSPLGLFLGNSWHVGSHVLHEVFCPGLARSTRRESARANENKPPRLQVIYFLYFLLLSERCDRIGIFVRYLRYPNFGLWSFIGILVGSCRIIGIDFNIGGPFSNRRIYGQFMTALGIMMINQWIFFIIMDRGFVCFVCPFFSWISSQK